MQIHVSGPLVFPIPVTDSYHLRILKPAADGAIAADHPATAANVVRWLDPAREYALTGAAPLLAVPAAHFVSLAQAILYRGTSIAIVWPQFLALVAIGSVFFLLALTRFRKTISLMA